MTFERTEVTQGHLRTLNLTIVSASLSAVGALLISINAQNLNQAVILGAGLAAGLVAVRRWESDRLATVLLPCLLVASAVWLYGMLGLDSPSASFGLSVVGTVVVLRLPRRHRHGRRTTPPSMRRA
jgi:two-component system sensor histidine kinase DesK